MRSLSVFLWIEHVLTVRLQLVIIKGLFFRYWFYKLVVLVAITVCVFYIPDDPFTYSKNAGFKLVIPDCLTEWLKDVCDCLSLQRGLSLAPVALSFLFWSSWCCWWTLLTPGMSPGLETWRTKTPGAGMQVCGSERLIKKNLKWPHILKMFLCFVALLVVMTLNYIMSLTAVVFCFIFYTKPDGCFINKFFIGFNMLLCVVASVVSVLRKVQVHSLGVSTSNTQSSDPKNVWDCWHSGRRLSFSYVHLPLFYQAKSSEITNLFCKRGLCLKAD